MNMKDLREIESKATEGPWAIEAHSGFGAVLTDEGDTIFALASPSHYHNDDPKIIEQCEPNAQFIAASRTALPKALDLLEEMAGALDGARKLIAKEVVRNVVPKEQESIYDTLSAYNQFKENVTE